MSREASTPLEFSPCHFPGMVDLARRYCLLIECSSAKDPGWLTEVADLLPRLHAAVTTLVAAGPSKTSDELTPDLDARFELFSHLRRLLGDRDGYWLEFDRVDDSQAMTGSLADDLTDIYCELKHGLRVMDRYPERAIQGWLSGYEFHWRRHLVDAQRHLAMLAAQGRLA
jgi:hypothetical protein